MANSGSMLLYAHTYTELKLKLNNQNLRILMDPYDSN